MREEERQELPLGQATEEAPREDAATDEKRGGWWLRPLAWLIIAGIVVALVFVGRWLYQKWPYRSLQVTATQTVEDARASNYINLDGRVLRCGQESAALIDRGQRTLWETAYQMNDPQVATRETTAAIYDVGGSNVVVCDTERVLGSFTTERPIRRAVVARQGTVAALMSEDGTSWICYYTKDGELIAQIKNSMTEPGYPMDLSLSPDGMSLAVSYLSYEDGVMQTLVNFYNFDSIGQKQVDNRTGQFRMEETLVPEIAFLDDATAVAFRDDGFSIFKGDAPPEKTGDVKIEEDIESIFYDDAHVGLVVSTPGEEQRFRLLVYDTDGREILSRAIDFSYERVEFSGTQISFYSRDLLCVYGLDGQEKYRGEITVPPLAFFALDTRQYLLTDENGISWMRLR